MGALVLSLGLCGYLELHGELQSGLEEMCNIKHSLIAEA